MRSKVKLASGIVLIVIWVLCELPVCKNSERTSDIARKWNQEALHLSDIGALLMRFQIRKRNKTWPSWEQLFEFGRDEMKDKDMKFTDPASGARLAWIYVAEGKSTAGQKRIIAAAPINAQIGNQPSQRNVRLILWSDLTAEFIDEAKFQSQIMGDHANSDGGN